MILVIQQITAKWTKQSRGAPHSARRNAVPTTLSLPNQFNTPQLESTPICIAHQHVLFDEETDFTPQETLTVHAVEPPNRHFKFGCIHPSFSQDTVEILFEYSTSCAGAPDRASPAKMAFELGVNDRGKIVYNGRFSRGYSGGWYYQKQVFNVMLLAEWSDKDVSLFVDHKPQKVYENLADLR